tara:strand:- start:482 stop:721 length:240 start_codon:yes stop_codon:yes gene_type:complete
MAVLTEGHNYQDYLISNTWSADEGITAQPQPQQMAAKVEPTKPDFMGMIRALPWAKIGLVGLGLVGFMLVKSGIEDNKA